MRLPGYGINQLKAEIRYVQREARKKINEKVVLRSSIPFTHRAPLGRENHVGNALLEFLMHVDGKASNFPYEEFICKAIRQDFPICIAGVSHAC